MEKVYYHPVLRLALPLPPAGRFKTIHIITVVARLSEYHVKIYYAER